MIAELTTIIHIAPLPRGLFHMSLQGIQFINAPAVIFDTMLKDCPYSGAGRIPCFRIGEYFGNFSQRKPKRFRLADELQSINIFASKQPVTVSRVADGMQKPDLNVIPNGIGGHTGMASQFLDCHHALNNCLLRIIVVIFLYPIFIFLRFCGWFVATGTCIR